MNYFKLTSIERIHAGWLTWDENFALNHGWPIIHLIGICRYISNKPFEQSKNRITRIETLVRNISQRDCENWTKLKEKSFYLK